MGNLVEKVLLSFDVTSLLTNIPLSETIKLGVDLIKTFQPDLNISEKDLKSFFNFAICETQFLFKDKFYEQIDGVAMRTPLAPVLANLLMGHYEKVWLINYNGVSTSYYTRYVDTFSVFNLRQNGFSLILNQDTLILNLLWKQRLTKLFPFWMSSLIIVTIF